MSHKPQMLRIAASEHATSIITATTMASRTGEDLAISASESIFDFFKPPRELRDAIYRHYSNPAPRHQGALDRYVDLPSPAALRVSKRFHAELSPIYYEGLKATMLSDCVCIKLSGQDAAGHVRHAGWNIWNELGPKCFTVWVRNGTEANDVVGWWVDVKKVSLRTLENDTNLSLQWWDEVFRLSDTLMKLDKLPQIHCRQVRSRLWALQARVGAVVMELRARQMDREIERVTLKEDSSVVSMRTSLPFLPRGLSYDGV